MRFDFFLKGLDLMNVSSSAFTVTIQSELIVACLDFINARRKAILALVPLLLCSITNPSLGFPCHHFSMV